MGTFIYACFGAIGPDFQGRFIGPDKPGTILNWNSYSLYFNNFGINEEF